MNRSREFNKTSYFRRFPQPHLDFGFFVDINDAFLDERSRKTFSDLCLLDIVGASSTILVPTSMVHIPHFLGAAERLVKTTEWARNVIPTDRNYLTVHVGDRCTNLP